MTPDRRYRFSGLSESIAHVVTCEAFGKLCVASCYWFACPLVASPAGAASPRAEPLCVHADRLHSQQCLAWHVAEPLENTVAKDTEELPCNHFQVCDSVAVSTFASLCHHRHRLQDCFHFAKPKPFMC